MTKVDDTWISASFPVALPRLKSVLLHRGWIGLADVPLDERTILEYLSSLGAIQPQYGGRLIWDVKMAHTGEGTSVGDAAIGWHTELTEFPITPAYVALLCLQQSAEGGELLLLDGRHALRGLSQEMIQSLFVDPHCTCVEPSISKDFEGMERVSPILFHRADDTLCIRFDEFFAKDSNSPAIVAFRNALHEAAIRYTVKIKQTSSTLLIWDNYRFLHGRNSFSDARRHLWRICIKDAMA